MVDNCGLMKLTEKELNYILMESTKRVVNEISWGTAADASKESENWTYQLEDAYDNFKSAASEMVDALQRYNFNRRAGEGVLPDNAEGAKLSWELSKLWKKIETFVERKQKQTSSLQGHEEEKFQQAFGGRDFDQVADDIDAHWDKHFNDHDGPYVPWDRYRKSVLSKDEQDFNDRNP